MLLPADCQIRRQTRDLAIPREQVNSKPSANGETNDEAVGKSVYSSRIR
jgi:hypothetical protein